MPRTKEINVAGISFTIASLTMRQVEELYPSSPEELDQARQKTVKDIQERIYTAVCYGLNNVYGTRPEDQKQAEAEGKWWTRARIMDEFDMVIFQGLHQEILVFSGLRPAEPEPEGEKAKGENQAAVVH